LGLLDPGLLALFAASFVSATVLPFPSEGVVAALQVGGYPPMLIFSVAVFGSMVGSILNYVAGRWTSLLLLKRLAESDPKRLMQAEGLFKRFGGLALLLCWIPLVGDPLTVVAGAARVSPALFLVWTTIGKCIKYAMVLGAVGWLQQQFGW
jgi:membrane protein YqaA with SNARE-associated domain